MRAIFLRKSHIPFKQIRLMYHTSYEITTIIFFDGCLDSHALFHLFISQSGITILLPLLLAAAAKSHAICRRKRRRGARL